MTADFSQNTQISRNKQFSGDISRQSPFFSKSVSMKGLLKALNSKWIIGSSTIFDKHLSRIVNIDLKTALRVFLFHQILAASKIPPSDFMQILGDSKK